MTHQETKTLAQFGITLQESARYNEVRGRFGTALAETELRHNLKSYEREFLMDEAVSLPHTYHLINGELYSQQNRHDLFNLKKQIDARERAGATLEGFGKYEALMNEAAPGSVSLWYSPDGPSGFEGVNFDSGRLYFGFKDTPETTVNFDIKVRPEFPVVPLLGQLHEDSLGIRPGFDSPEEAKMYYLRNPFTYPGGAEELFAFMDEYAREEESPVYVSRRAADNPAYRTLSSAVGEMKELLASYHTPVPPVYDPSGDKTVGAMMHEDDLLRRYMAVIAPYVADGNGTVTLYGCSTTSTVTRNDVQSIMAGHSVNSLISLYSSARRLLTRELPSSFETPKDRYDDYECPHCKALIQGEVKGKPETWKSECPSCHGKLHCAK